MGSNRCYFKSALSEIESRPNDIERIARETGISIHDILTELDNTLKLVETVGGFDSFEQFYTSLAFCAETLDFVRGDIVSGVLFLNDLHGLYGIFDTLQRLSQGLPTPPAGAGAVFGGIATTMLELVTDIAEMTNDSQTMWGFANAIAHDKATNLVIEQNMDILNELRRSPRLETRRAAQFVLDAFADNMRSAWTLQAEILSTQGLGAAIDLGQGMLGIASIAYPPLVVVTLPLAVFGVLDTGFGWSDNIETQARFFVISDMTDASSRLIGRVYFRDEAALHRHLTNLANLRVIGETRFMDLRRVGAGAAQQNINRVRTLADMMELPIFPR